MTFFCNQTEAWFAYSMDFFEMLKTIRSSLSFKELAEHQTHESDFISKSCTASGGGTVPSPPETSESLVNLRDVFGVSNKEPSVDEIKSKMAWLRAVMDGKYDNELHKRGFKKGLSFYFK